MADARGLNEDLHIIAKSNLEITPLNGSFNIIQQLDDEPNDVGGLSAAELKAKFDQAGVTIQSYINETLIPEVLGAESTEAQRQANETERQANEVERQVAEEARETEFRALMESGPWAVSNPNLLDNWYFPDPINQRGIVSGAAISAGYFLDRWYNIGNTNAAWIDGEGIKFAGLSSNVVMEQQLERGWIPDGTVVTASMLYKLEGETTLRLVSVTGSWGSSAFSETVNGVAVKLDLKSATGNPMVRIYVYIGHPTVVVKAVKLELGAQQTLAHQDASGGWVLNDPPPNKALELAKCQRYQVNLAGYGAKSTFIGTGISYDEKTAVFLCPLNTELRANPTISYSGIFVLHGPKYGNTFPVTKLSTMLYSSRVACLEAKVAPGLTVGGSYLLLSAPASGATTELMLDANL